MTLLFEQQQLFIYEDSTTGKKYLFDGSKLVLMPDNDSKDSPYHLDMDDSESANSSTNNEETQQQNSNPSENNSEESSNKEDTSDDVSDDATSETSSDSDSTGDQKENAEDGSANGDNTESNTNNKSNLSDSENSERQPTGKSSGKSDNDEEQESNSNNQDASKPESSNGTKSNSDTASAEEEELNSDLSDLDWDDLSWDDLKNEIDEILDKINELSEDKQQKFYDELKKHLDEVDTEVLEHEEEERQKQIEEEASSYDPANDDSGVRLKEIASKIGDQSTMNDLLDETERKVRQSRKAREDSRKKAEAEAAKYNANKGVEDLVIDLNRLIKSEIKKITSKSWGKINKKMDGTGIMKPGKTKKKNPEVPRLFVYFDQSGSWGQRDIEVGKNAIQTLNTYVKKNQLIIELYYFGNVVSTNPETVGRGTGAGALLIEHIKINKPDNVLIMTDDDFDYWDEILEAPSISVSGGAFLMFRNGSVSKRLVDRVRGKKLTKIYTF